jgi:non-ribosomal peptide synthetase component F
LQLAPVTFDAATFEIWGALLHGGRCVLFDEALPTLASLGETLAREQVTTLFLTTAFFNTIIDEQPQILATVQQLFTGGEAHSVSHMKRALSALAQTQIVSVYGPTETTTFATYHPVCAVADTATSIPLGRPIAHTDVFVLDQDLRPREPGIVGEIYIAGPGLARGYLNRDELTQERFIDAVPRALGVDRLYRTGDLAKTLPDGTIDFVGRADQQVKIHGFRIELGEIEARLLTCVDVRQAAVVVRDRGYADRRLVAYVVAATEGVDTSTVRAFLAARLPKYMVPTNVHLLRELPLTPTGKVDRQALRELSGGAKGTSS